MTPTSPRSAPKSSVRFGPGAAFALAVAIALGFALFTDQRWEDYYITFRVSRNLATGFGLVFQQGERVHAFTSPLGVLLPALISWTTENRSDELTLWIFRSTTILAFGGAAATVWSIARKLGWGLLPRAFAAGLLMTDAKSVSFAVNGMETAFMLLFLALAIRQLAEGPGACGWRLGACWAGLMWTRPDSFMFFGSIALGLWLFAPLSPSSGGRRAVAWLCGKAAVACAALYLPWFVWAWCYFGSPVPHPIIAKALSHHLPGWTTLFIQFATLPIRAWIPGAWDTVLLPIYFGGWPHFIAHIGRPLIAIALGAFALPRMDPWVRILSLALVLAVFYLVNLDPFPWYFPPAAMMTCLVLAGVLEAALVATRQRFLPVTAAAAALLFAGSLLVLSSWELRQQQRIVEGQRRAIGEWLNLHRQSPADTVFLEPLGYIGYYSQMKMLDFPGLASTEVIAARRKVGDNWLSIIGELKPRWVVQRPQELHTEDQALNRWYFDHYYPAQVFHAGDQISAVRFLPGRPYLVSDQAFLVWMRKD
jgi:hypothetical protein